MSLGLVQHQRSWLVGLVLLSTGPAGQQTIQGYRDRSFCCLVEMHKTFNQKLKIFTILLEKLC